MRDPNRLDEFYNELKVYHKTYFPDWRFGQLMVNFQRWMSEKYVHGDIFYIEEDKMLDYFCGFIDDMMKH